MKRTNYKTADDLHKAGLFTYWDIMQDDIEERGLTCIDTSIMEDCLLCRNDKTSKVHFIYSTDYNNEMGFDFSLLCEVGSKVYQPIFEKMIKRNGYKLQIVETSTDYYEILVKA